MARVPVSEKTRNELKDMFAGKSPTDRSRLVRQAARLIVEEALESEAADALGRGYYERGSSGRNRPDRARFDVTTPAMSRPEAALSDDAP